MLLLTQIRLVRSPTSTVMSHCCIEKLQVMVLLANDFHSRFASVYQLPQQGKRPVWEHQSPTTPAQCVTGLMHSLYSLPVAVSLRFQSETSAALIGAQAISKRCTAVSTVYRGLPCLRQFSQLFSFFHSELIHGCSDICALILQLQVRCGCRYD